MENHLIQFFADEQLTELEKPLNGENVSERQGLSYLEGWHVINEANRIFGFGNWSGEITELVHLGDETFEKNGKQGYRTAYRARYRISVTANPNTLDDNSFPRQTYFEDVGFGNATNYSSVLDNHELASKESVTDAMKRCLRNFGSQFGNALYDKQQRNVKQAITLSDVTALFKSMPAAKKDAVKTGLAAVLEEAGFSKLTEANPAALEKAYEYLKAA